jgi:hypothetical protein
MIHMVLMVVLGLVICGLLIVLFRIKPEDAPRATHFSARTDLIPVQRPLPPVPPVKLRR